MQLFMLLNKGREDTTSIIVVQLQMPNLLVQLLVY